jgi:hypothetical protein
LVTTASLLSSCSTDPNIPTRPSLYQTCHDLFGDTPSSYVGILSELK